MTATRVDRFVRSLRDRSADRSTQVDVDQIQPLVDNATGSALLDSKVLAKIGKLEFIAKTVVDGVMSGLHRSTHKGGSSEFDQHRPYSQGDDVRMLDWRLYAKSDRYFVKQFEDHTNLHAWMIVDASASMNFGLSTQTKIDYARTACACLARLLLKQRDSIGLCIRSRGHKKVIPPKPQAKHFHAICRSLEQLAPSGNSTIASQLRDVSQRLTRRGLICVFSDCFEDVAQLTHEAQSLRLRGYDVVIFQTLAPEEVTFNFRKSARFEDLEGVLAGLDVHPGAMRKRYLKSFNAFMAELEQTMIQIDCDLVQLRTDQDLGDTLAKYLRHRAARLKKRRA